MSPQVSATHGARRGQQTQPESGGTQARWPPRPHSRQCPAEATCRLIWCVQAWTCSSHSLAYVCPSEPHTGWAEATHSEGHTQRPVSASHRAPKRHCPHRSGEGALSPWCQEGPPPSPARPLLTTGSSAGHPDIPPQSTGHGLQLARAAVGDAVTAAHRVVDARARLLALAHGLPILHGARCPERALHPTARGWSLVWGGQGSQPTCCPHSGKAPSPRSRPTPGVGWSRKSWMRRT